MDKLYDPPSRQVCPCVRATREVIAFLDTLSTEKYRAFFTIANQLPCTQERRSYFRFKGPAGAVKVWYRSRNSSTVTLLRVNRDARYLYRSRAITAVVRRAIPQIYYALGICGALFAIVQWFFLRI